MPDSMDTIANSGTIAANNPIYCQSLGPGLYKGVHYDYCIQTSFVGELPESLLPGIDKLCLEKKLDAAYSSTYGRLFFDKIKLSGSFRRLARTKLSNGKFTVLTEHVQEAHKLSDSILSLTVWIELVADAVEAVFEGYAGEEVVFARKA